MYESFTFGNQNVEFFDGEGWRDLFIEHEISLGEDGTSLVIKAIDGPNIHTVRLTGIADGYYLHQATITDNSQSVKLWQQNLVISVGTIFVNLSWPELKLNWKLKPDICSIFEFYDLEDDILLRGELEIFRINVQGEIVWRFGGKDIWVNIDGKPEVTILEKSIQLIDFEGNEYLIDFNGNSLSFTERKKNIQILRKPWWKFWM